MILSCEIIQDLLPLYADNVCSPDSQKAVDEHLVQCPACRQNLQTLKQPDLTAGLGLETAPEPVIRERVMKNGFKKLRRRWLLSVWSVFLIFPVLLLSLMGIHEYRGEGIAFTNLDEIFAARRLMHLIEEQRFNEAAELLDFEHAYRDIQEVLSLQPEDFIPSFELCTVDGALWLVQDYLSEQYQILDICESEDSAWFWDYLIFTDMLYTQNILIPESAWTQFCQRWEGTPEYQEAQASYFPLDTPWGCFYTDSSSLLDLTAAGPTAENLFQRMTFIPYEIYQAAQESIEQQAFENYQWNQEHYAFAADMTQEEYVQNMKDKFIRPLEACCSDGFTIQNPHFTESYRIGGQWNIEISVMLQDPTGQRNPAGYCFMVQNGKLRLASTSHPSEYSADSDPISRAFRITHP